MTKLIKQIYQSILNSKQHEYNPQNWQKSTIVFAPHQDDETLGCGGTIIRKKQAGATVKIVFMTDGSGSHAHLMPAAELKQIREQEAIAAAEVLSVSSEDVVFLAYKDGNLQNFQAQAVEKVVEILQTYQPEEIFIPYYRDVIADHIATNQIVIAALEKCQIKATVYEYPIWFWRHFPWTSFGSNLKEALSVLKSTVYARFGVEFVQQFHCRVNIQDVLSQKKKALAQHKSQMEQLLPNCGWIRLQDLVRGEFLACFLQDFELFYQRKI
ncbi:LmbE family protein [Stanieria sp. NIES-3757]|nr:LmbE family protein [Stanieria sp. NIES-3757]